MFKLSIKTKWFNIILLMKRENNLVKLSLII